MNKFAFPAMALLLAGTAFAEGNEQHKQICTERERRLDQLPSGQRQCGGDRHRHDRLCPNDVYGWINLAPAHGGVLNDGNGTLSGNAWESRPDGSIFGVTIGSDGMFHGTASGTTSAVSASIVPITIRAVRRISRCRRSGRRRRAVHPPPVRRVRQTAHRRLQSHGGGGAACFCVSRSHRFKYIGSIVVRNRLFLLHGCGYCSTCECPVQMRTCARVQKGVYGQRLLKRWLREL